MGVLDRLARCFSDYRNANSVERSVRSRMTRAFYALAMGSEDPSDREALRGDSLLALLVGNANL